MTLEQFISQQSPERIAKLRSGDRAEAEALANEFNSLATPRPEQAAPQNSFTKDELPQYLSSLEQIKPVLHSRIKQGDATAAQEALDFDAKNFARFQAEGLGKLGENDLEYFRWAKARGLTKNDESVVSSFARGVWNLAKGGGSFLKTLVQAQTNPAAGAELAATLVEGAQTNASDSRMLGAGLAVLDQKTKSFGSRVQNIASFGLVPVEETKSELVDAAEFELARFSNEERARQGEWRRAVGGEAFAQIPVDENAAEFIGEVFAPDNLMGAGLGRAVVKQGLKRGLINEGIAKVALADVGLAKAVPLVGQAEQLSKLSLAARETLTSLEAKLANARLTMDAAPAPERAAYLKDVVEPLQQEVAKARADFQSIYGKLEANRAAITEQLDSSGVGLTDRAVGGVARGVGSVVQWGGEKMTNAWRAVRGVADGEGDQLVDNLADQATGGATAALRQGNLVTRAGRDMKVLGELYAQGETSLPFFARVRQSRKAGRLTRAAAALLDESRLGWVGAKGAEFAKAGAAGAPVSGAFGYAASGGDINAAAESAGFGAGMGVAGGAYGQWETYRDPQVKIDELLGNRRAFRQWLSDAGDKQSQLALFDQLDPENQVLIASYAHAQPDVAFVFDRAGRNGPAGFYDRERNVITLNVEHPDALSKTFAHEISHFVERHGLSNQVRDAYLGNAETGQIGQFTKIGEDGKPVVRESAQPDGTTRKEYELNDEGLALKNEYEQRARASISPDFVLTPEAFASELFAEQYADQLFSGEFLRDLKGSPIDAIANSSLVKGALGKLGVMFDEDGKVVGTGLFKNLSSNRTVSKLIREYNRQSARGKRPEMSEDVDFELTEEALKNSELAVKWLQAGGAVKFDADGKPVYKGDRPQFLTSKEAEQIQRDLANELIKEIDAWNAANPDNPDAVQKRADGLYAGSFIPPEIIDKIEAQRKFNPYQLATLRAASQTMKQNGPGAILAHFYQAAQKKGSSGYKTVAGRWRKDAIYGIRITKDANVLLQSFSWEQLFENARKASKTKRARELWGTSGEALDSAIVGDVVQYLRNLEGGEPGATLLGEDKKDFINNLLGIRMAANEGVNPEFNRTSAPKTIITSLRLDRMNRLTPLDTVEFAWGVDQYQRAKNNFTPGSEEPLDLSSVRQFGSLRSLWISPEGQAFDVGNHGIWSLDNHNKTAAELIRDGWVRVNVSPLDKQILVERRKLSSAAKGALDELRFSQGLEVVDDNGTVIFNAPEDSTRYSPGTQFKLTPEEKSSLVDTYNFMLNRGDFTGKPISKFSQLPKEQLERVAQTAGIILDVPASGGVDAGNAEADGNGVGVVRGERAQARNRVSRTGVQFTGRPLEGSVGEELELVHFSNTLSSEDPVVDPAFMGKGRATTRDMAAMPSGFFYRKGTKLNTDRDIIARGKQVYSARVNGGRIYDGVADSLNYWEQPNREKRDQMLIDKGFVGVLVRLSNGTEIVRMFEPVPVESRGPGEKAVKSGKALYTPGTRIGVAPLRSTSVDNFSPESLDKINTPLSQLEELANRASQALGLRVTAERVVGGWQDTETGNVAREGSLRLVVQDDATPEQLRALAAFLGENAPEKQNAVMIFEPGEGDWVEHAIGLTDAAAAEKITKELGRFGLGAGFSFDPASNTLFIATPAGDTNVPKLLEYAKSEGLFTSYDSETGTAVFPGSDEYAGLIEPFKESLAGSNLRSPDGKQFSPGSVSTVAIRKGEEKLDLGPSPSVLEIGRALAARARKVKRIPYDSRTDAAKDAAATAFADEIEYAASLDRNAIGWYERKITEAMDSLAKLHPELKDDQNLSTFYKAILAITSNGQAVTDNFMRAEQVYREWKEVGRVPVDAAWGGDRSNQINGSLAKLQALVDMHGLEATREFLMREFRYGEIKKLAKQTLGIELGATEPVDHVVRGAIIFGPKVGGAFFPNLNGDFRPITMDLWLTRTWNRINGSYGQSDTVAMGRALEKLRNAASENPGHPDAAKLSTMSDRQLGNWAAVRFADWKNRRKFKDGDAFDRPAKNYVEAKEGKAEAPRSGSERAWLREIFREIDKKLAERGLPAINNADKQALLWYYEKDLYRTLGYSDSRGQPADYADAARKVLETFGR